MAKTGMDLDSFMEGGSPSLLDYKREDEKRYKARGESGGSGGLGGKRALEKELRKGAEFLGWFALFAIAAYLVFSLSEVAAVFSAIAAAQSSFFLTLSGTQNSIQWINGIPHLMVSSGAAGGGIDAEIGELCWGKIEFCVLLGIIAASFDRTRNQRLWGIALGFVFFALFFNPLRIVFSLLSQNPLVHDVLFRVTLVAAIAFYYFLWYLWTGRKKDAPSF